MRVGERQCHAQTDRMMHAQTDRMMSRTDRRLRPAGSVRLAGRQVAGVTYGMRPSIHTWAASYVALVCEPEHRDQHRPA